MLSLPDGAPEPAWRLVASLYAQPRSLVQGSLALVAVLAVCWWRTHWVLFGLLAAVAVALLVQRLRHRAQFWRARSAAPVPDESKDPQQWAGEFAAGACAAAAIWGVTDVCALVYAPDPALPFFVLMVQFGWIGGAAVRNAAAPTAVIGQASLTLLPCLATALLLPDRFTHVAALFIALQYIASLGTVSYLSEQIVALMQSEQALAAAEARLALVSATDGLTGIANRRAFDTALQVEWGRAAREASDIGVLLIDIDYFKLYNDQYGHLLGDDCLRVVAGLVHGALRRPPDLAARYASTSFAVLLPATGESGARDVADRLRASLAGAGLPHAVSPYGLVTVSIGVASMAPAPGNAAQSLITLAEQALHDAKDAGRNRVRGAADRLQLGAWRAQLREDADLPLPRPAGSPAPPPAATTDRMPTIPPGLPVLVLEDDAMVAVLLEDMLGELGCTVIGPCRSAAAAMALVERTPPRVALLDINIGATQEGFVVAGALMALGVPFAFVTAAGPDALRPEFAGRPILPKPFHFAMLIRLIAELTKA